MEFYVDFYETFYFLYELMYHMVLLYINKFLCLYCSHTRCVHKSFIWSQIQFCSFVYGYEKDYRYNITNLEHVVSETISIIITMNIVLI